MRLELAQVCAVGTAHPTTPKIILWALPTLQLELAQVYAVGTALPITINY